MLNREDEDSIELCVAHINNCHSDASVYVEMISRHPVWRESGARRPPNSTHMVLTGIPGNFDLPDDEMGFEGFD